MKRLGIGILSHFTMQRTYIAFFLLLTIITYPLNQVYQDSAKNSRLESETYSIGDLPSSKSHYLISLMNKTLSL